MTDMLVFAESCGKNQTVHYKCREIVYSGQSKFQKFEFVDTLEYGRMLFLDGVAQSSARDEFIYHEIVVHPALLTHPRPRSVCVIGGAEGATLREIFRHPEITRVVMVDIDEDLVHACQQYLPEYGAGAFQDPRLELHFTDGRAFLENTSEKFDVILVDLSDPVPDSPSVLLFTVEFYKTIHDRLTENGTACIQGESLQPWRVELHARMRNTLAAAFPHVAAFPYSVPCFHEIHAMIVVSKGDDPRKADLGGRMLERSLELKYLSPTFLPGLFYVPAYVEQAYSTYREILTDSKPLALKGYRFSR
ncbi:MAG: spermidine synthase [Deltaproteobacteria bacterium]|nr:spermidine synthase [Deltaproteobacteria bacterium]